MIFRSKFKNGLFDFVYNHNLIYNTCWEDPRIDRMALNLGKGDTVLAITSAGCNILDYALLGPKRIYAVDMNYRQTALLELKLAGIRALDFEPFFDLFGRGYLADYRPVYHTCLRPFLSPVSQAFWDRHIIYFSGKGWQPTFYFHGTAGIFARLIKAYVDCAAEARAGVEAILNASSLQEQRDIYDTYLRGTLQTRFIRWFVQHNVVLSLLGIPPSQRHQVERNYRGGIVQFMQDCVEAVFTLLPFRDNYFWQVYLRGAYTPDCCPEYLKPANFRQLKDGLVERISIHTSSLLRFLVNHDVCVSRVLLLDHMDWLSLSDYSVLQQEWQAIVDHALAGARILWRSGGLRVDYVDPIDIVYEGRRCRLGDLLTYHGNLATRLHAKDRVHTYGSLYIADLPAAS